MVEQVNNYLDFKAQPLFKEYQCGGSITMALIILIRKPLSVKSKSASLEKSLAIVERST
jgi:hypothetical protein